MQLKRGRLRCVPVLFPNAASIALTEKRAQEHSRSWARSLSMNYD